MEQYLRERVNLRAQGRSDLEVNRGRRFLHEAEDGHCGRRVVGRQMCFNDGEPLSDTQAVQSSQLGSVASMISRSLIENKKAIAEKISSHLWKASSRGSPQEKAELYLSERAKMYSQLNSEKSCDRRR